MQTFGDEMLLNPSLPRIAVVVLTVALLPFSVIAQDLPGEAPSGACLMPDGTWCWPQRVVNYGEVCVCETEKGQVRGIAR